MNNIRFILLRNSHAEQIYLNLMTEACSNLKVLHLPLLESKCANFFWNNGSLG